MPYCTKCGAEITAPGRVCPKCGRAAKGLPAAWGSLLGTAGLVLLVLALAFGGFRAVSAPRQSTPAGSLALLLDGLAGTKTDQILGCLDLTPQQRADGRTLLAANGGAVLLRNFLNAFALDPGALPPPEQDISSVRVAASRYHYTDYGGSACTLAVLLRIATPGGEYELALSGVPSVRKGGTWLIAV